MRNFTPRLTGRASNQMQLRADDRFSSGEDLIGQELPFHIFKAKTRDGICEPFAGLALFPEQKNRFFNNGKDFFLTGKHRA